MSSLLKVSVQGNTSSQLHFEKNMPFRAYPNPLAEEYLAIEFDREMTGWYSIANAQGSLMLREKFTGRENLRIHRDILGEGLRFINISFGDKIYTFKLLVIQ